MCPGLNQHGLHVLLKGCPDQSFLASDDQELQDSNLVWVVMRQVRSIGRLRLRPNGGCRRLGEVQGNRDSLAEATKLLFH